MDRTFDTGNSARRATIFGLIVAFHVVIIWALNSSLARQTIERAFAPIQAEIIEEVETDDEPPPPPPTVETPPPYVPPPDIVIDLPVESTTSTALTNVTNVPKPVAPPPVAAKVKKAPEIAPGAKRRFQPDYPPTSRRLGEEGSVILQVMVGTDGKVQEAKVQTSSGFPRLDEAALKHALRAWRFNPGTEDGKPVAMWHSIKVTFKIQG